MKIKPGMYPILFAVKIPIVVWIIDHLKNGSANRNREDSVLRRIQKFLKKPEAVKFVKAGIYRKGKHPYWGHCYVASEVLYHMLGGESSGYEVFQMEHENQSHWFLKNRNGRVLDPTWQQFTTKPDHSKARRTPFMWTEDGISDRAERMQALV